LVPIYRLPISRSPDRFLFRDHPIEKEVVREAHNNCVNRIKKNRILKDLQSPEIVAAGLSVITADGAKTMQSLWLTDPLVHLGTWEQFVGAAWSARCTRLGIDETRMETGLDDQSCAACTSVCQCINTLPGTTEGEVTCCLCIDSEEGANRHEARGLGPRCRRTTHAEGRGERGNVGLIG